MLIFPLLCVFTCLIKYWNRLYTIIKTNSITFSNNRARMIYTADNIFTNEDLTRRTVLKIIRVFLVLNPFLPGSGAVSKGYGSATLATPTNWLERKLGYVYTNIKLTTLQVITVFFFMHPYMWWIKFVCTCTLSVLFDRTYIFLDYDINLQYCSS